MSVPFLFSHLIVGMGEEADKKSFYLLCSPGTGGLHFVIITSNATLIKVLPRKYYQKNSECLTSNNNLLIHKIKV